jgi:hypothetical protein
MSGKYSRGMLLALKLSPIIGTGGAALNPGAVKS